MRRPTSHGTTLVLSLLLVLLSLAAACGRKGDPHPRSDVHKEAARVQPSGG